MALGNFGLSVAALHGRAGLYDAGICAQTQRAALVYIIALTGHKVNDLVLAELVELARVSVLYPRNVAGIFYNRYLHSQADSEIGNVVLPGVFRRKDHALYSSAAEAAGNDYPVQMRELALVVRLGQSLRIDPVDADMCIERIARVAQRLGYGQIRIVELNIFADKSDFDFLFAVLYAVDKLRPLVEIRLGSVDTQLAADDRREVRPFEHKRRLVEVRQGDVLDNAVGLYVAEKRYLFKYSVLERLVTAQDDYIRIYAHALKLLYGVLSGLRLMLVRSTQKRHQSDMDKEAVFPPYLERNLSYSFEERLGFNVTYSAADLSDDHVGIGFLADTVYDILYFICYMGYDLNSRAEILAAALLVEHVPIHLAGGEVRILVEVLVDKTLVVAEVKVGLRAVLRDVNLAVLIGTHGTRINVDIGVELLRRNLEPARFENSSERRRSYSLSEAGDDSSGHKDILCH